MNPPDRLRLAPEMVSTRLLVLAFVRDYWARWGASPSQGEIAAAVGASKGRVRIAVKSLAAAGLLIRTPGPRGLSLPTIEAEAVRVLTSLGFQVLRPDAAQSGAANDTLPSAERLDYFPGHGKKENKRIPSPRQAAQRHRARR